MSKVTYIIKASNDVLNEKTAAILVQVAKTNFITSAQIRENLAEEMNASSVNSNIGVLIKKGFIEKSEDGLIASSEGMNIVMAAADLYAAEVKPDLVKTRKTRSARGVTPAMEVMAELVKTSLENKIDIKEIAENRSNLEVRLAKRTLGIRQFEIRRDGSMRIFGYNMKEDDIKMFTSLGYDSTSKVGGKNVYIDFPNVTSDIVEIVTNLM